MIFGSLFSASAMSLGVVTAISAMSTEVIGVGERTLSVMTRDPVTVMVSRFSRATSCEVVLAACAQAEVTEKDAVTLSAAMDARINVCEVI